MKVREQKEAIKLRESGYTYREILKQIPVSKGSLSYWLRNVELTDEQKQRIYNNSLEIRKKFVEYNKLKHKNAISKKKKIFESARKEMRNISAEDLKLIGTALYWAEGYKTDAAKSVEFANSDPYMIELIMKWFRNICNVPENKFRVRIQIHDVGNVKEASKFWSLKTGVPLKQFTKPYIKISPTSKMKVGNFLQYGICHIRISDTELLAKIKGWIRGLSGPMV